MNATSDNGNLALKPFSLDLEQCFDNRAMKLFDPAAPCYSHLQEEDVEVR